MAILREAAVDILVTVFIVVATSLDLLWGRWILIVYTTLMLVLKIAALSSGGVRNITTQQRQGRTPIWLFHLLYAINVIALGVAGWWALFVGWGLIWIVSILVEQRSGGRAR